MSLRALIGFALVLSTLVTWPTASYASDSPVHSRIIGGEAAPAGTWPAIAGLAIGLTDGADVYERRCGGTLIAPTIILTAAHCLEPTSSLVFDLPSSYATIGGGAFNSDPVAWSSVSIHAAYANLDYDIALIQLAAASANEPMPLLPAWQEGLLTDGTPLDTAGYGQDAQGTPGTEPLSDVLLETRLPYVDAATCARFWGPYATPRVLCAGYRGAAGRNVCVGDSGGPLALPLAGTRLLVGATSYVEQGSCDPAWPAGFASIPALRPWILDAANGPEHVAVRAWLETQAAEAGLSVESAGPEVTLRWSVTPTNWTTTGFTTVVNGITSTTTDATTTRRVSLPQGGRVTASVTPTVEVGTAIPATFDGTPTPTRVPVVAASIEGLPRVGARMTAAASSDDPWGSAPALQWTWNDEPIPGATATSYRPTREQMGGRIGVVATATNVLGAASGSARATTLVTAHPRTARSARATLQRRRGDVLVVTTPPATGYPTPKVTYRWLRDGRAIRGATGTAYRLTAADRSRTIAVRITYRNSVGSTTLTARGLRVQ